MGPSATPPRSPAAAVLISHAGHQSARSSILHGIQDFLQQFVGFPLIRLNRGDFTAHPFVGLRRGLPPIPPPDFISTRSKRARTLVGKPSATGPRHAGRRRRSPQSSPGTVSTATPVRSASARTCAFLRAARTVERRGDPESGGLVVLLDGAPWRRGPGGIPRGPGGYLPNGSRRAFRVQNLTFGTRRAGEGHGAQIRSPPGRCSRGVSSGLPWYAGRGKPNEEGRSTTLACGRHRHRSAHRCAGVHV